MICRGSKLFQWQITVINYLDLDLGRNFQIFLSQAPSGVIISIEFRLSPKWCSGSRSQENTHIWLCKVVLTFKTCMGWGRTEKQNRIREGPTLCHFPVEIQMVWELSLWGCKAQGEGGWEEYSEVEGLRSINTLWQDFKEESMILWNGGRRIKIRERYLEINASEDTEWKMGYGTIHQKHFFLMLYCSKVVRAWALCSESSWDNREMEEDLWRK